MIEWVNNDFIAHTATARDQRFDVMLEPGKSGRYTVQQAGLIEYYCRFHPNMTGRVSVGEYKVGPTEQARLRYRYFPRSMPGVG